MREGLKDAWAEPKITWAGATFEDPQQVQAAVAKIPKKYDVIPPPAPLLQPNPKGQVVLNQKPSPLYPRMKGKPQTSMPIFYIWKAQNKIILKQKLWHHILKGNCTKL